MRCRGTETHNFTLLRYGDMTVHARSLIKRNSYFIGLFAPCFFNAACRNFSFFRCSSSFPYLEDSSSSRETHIHCGEGKTSRWAKSSEFDVLIAKIRAATSVDEIFMSINHDPVCNALQISDSIVDVLLHQFREDWKSALGFFRWAESRPGYRPLPESYDRMVDILGKAKQMNKMRELVEEMRLSNFVTLSTIAKVMRRLAGAGEWEHAVRIFDELDNFGLVKNTESMNLLLDTLCKENKVEQSRAIFLDLKSHIPPTAHTFNIFIHGWCKINRVDEAYWTIQEMKGQGCRPCVISYSTIIQSYCRQSRFHKVYELLDAMQAQGCPPNVVTYTTVMYSLAKSGEFEEALQIPERMRSVGCKPDTLFYNVLIHTLGRSNRLQEAVHVFEVDMPKFGVIPNTPTYNSMIAMFCRHDELEKAVNVLKDMENCPFCKPDAQSYCPLLKSCFKYGKIDSWLCGMLDDMVHKHGVSLDISTFTLLIHGLCRANKCEWAYMLFEEMISQDITPRYQTCQLLLDEIKQKNMYDAAEMIEGYIKQMQFS